MSIFNIVNEESCWDLVAFNSLYSNYRTETWWSGVCGGQYVFCKYNKNNPFGKFYRNWLILFSRATRTKLQTANRRTWSIERPSKDWRRWRRQIFKFYKLLKRRGLKITAVGLRQQYNFSRMNEVYIDVANYTHVGPHARSCHCRTFVSVKIMRWKTYICGVITVQWS